VACGHLGFAYRLTTFSDGNTFGEENTGELKRARWSAVVHLGIGSAVLRCCGGLLFSVASAPTR
jgi:hypothetical protein